MAGKGQFTGEDPNESLVKALESIKSLLEKSESKLSAARSSIEKARTSSGLPATPDDDLVPVLEDIVTLQQEIEAQVPAKSSEAGLEVLKQQLRDEMQELLRIELHKLETKIIKEFENRLSQLKPKS